MSKYPRFFDGFAKRGEKQTGFIQLPLMGWVVLILGTIVLILGISLKVQSSRLQAEKEAHEATQLAYKGFVAEVRRQGEAAEKKVAAEKARQAKVNQERVKGYEKRISDIAAAYQRVLGESSGAGGRDLPAVPDTARAVDDTARDQQLSSLLRHADEQTARLIELQRWVREQGNP